MSPALRRVLTWIVVSFGGFLVLVGLLDFATGPEQEALETGVQLSETAPRWLGLIFVAVGAAIIALAMRLEVALKRMNKEPQR